jgi:hypothetical protein
MFNCSYAAPNLLFYLTEGSNHWSFRLQFSGPPSATPSPREEDYESPTDLTPRAGWNHQLVTLKEGMSVF